MTAIPSTEEIRKNGNPLAKESSAYLQQHAFNPVYWYPWGEEAIQRARKEDKPIFLSIGYSSCHWCHVMEEKVFEKDDIAKHLNENYVCIKVDREERPDLDGVYMAGVQAMSGGGGWPLSVFLLPDLRPFFGGTYYPPDQFIQIIERALALFKTQREKLLAQGESVQKYISAISNLGEGEDIIPDQRIQEVAESLVAHVDYEWGGFKSQMKFPTPVRWQFMLHRFRKSGSENLGKAVRVTLDRIAEGGIHDHLGGGFHRYSVDSEWTVPHFEKMLYDNAQLASIYLEAAVALERPWYTTVAEQTLEFLLREMQAEEGAFYASFDADTEGGEGLFYIWTPELIQEVCGVEGDAVCRLSGVTEEGNFGGVNVLTKRITEKKLAELELTREQAEELLDKWREPLRETRARRIAPALDMKVVTAWNALTITALCRGYEALDGLDYLLAAKKAAQYLWEHHWDPDTGLVRSSTGGEKSAPGILDDYAFFANALLDLFRADADPIHLQRAQKLVAFVRDHFANPDGAYFQTSDQVEQPMGRRVEFIDSVEPSGNAMLMLVYLKLAGLTGEESFRDEVRRVIAGYTNVLEKSGQELAMWMDVAGFYHGPFHEVVIVGAPDDAATTALLRSFREQQLANAVLSFAPGEEPSGELRDLLPPVGGKATVEGEPAAYVCRFGACDAPVTSPEELKEKLV